MKSESKIKQKDFFPSGLISLLYATSSFLRKNYQHQKYCLIMQWKPIDVFSLGQHIFDHINQMITKADYISILLQYAVKQVIKI